MGLKREHRENLNRLTRSQEVALFNVRGEHAHRICESEERISHLETEIINLRQQLETNRTIADIQVILHNMFSNVSL